MPRMVRMNMNGPIRIEPQEKTIWVCGCGLSRTFPFCDGTHKKCREVETDPAAVYIYDADRAAIVETRREAAGEEPRPR